MNVVITSDLTTMTQKTDASREIATILEELKEEKIYFSLEPTMSLTDI